MSEKSYLKNQIRLVSLNANDLFTDEEQKIFLEIGTLSNEIEQCKGQEEKARRSELIAEKKKKSALLAETIKKHAGTPRKVRLKSVLTWKEGDPEPVGATWRRLKFSRKINEFESDMSRAMGLHHLDQTFDKIIVKWGEKKMDITRQMVVDGFEFDILEKDGTVTTKRYRCLTASAGQLRRDKFQAISEDAWAKIRNRMECGLDWEELNKQGGINVN